MGCTPATCAACWPGRPVDIDGSSAIRLQYIHDQAGPCPGRMCMPVFTCIHICPAGPCWYSAAATNQTRTPHPVSASAAATAPGACLQCGVAPAAGLGPCMRGCAAGQLALCQRRPRPNLRTRRHFQHVPNGRGQYKTPAWRGPQQGSCRQGPCAAAGCQQHNKTTVTSKGKQSGTRLSLRYFIS